MDEYERVLQRMAEKYVAIKEKEKVDWKAALEMWAEWAQDDELEQEAKAIKQWFWKETKWRRRELDKEKKVEGVMEGLVRRG